MTPNTRLHAPHPAPAPAAPPAPRLIFIPARKQAPADRNGTVSCCCVHARYAGRARVGRGWQRVGVHLTADAARRQRRRGRRLRLCAHPHAHKLADARGGARLWELCAADGGAQRPAAAATEVARLQLDQCRLQRYLCRGRGQRLVAAADGRRAGGALQAARGRTCAGAMAWRRDAERRRPWSGGAASGPPAFGHRRGPSLCGDQPSEDRTPCPGRCGTRGRRTTTTRTFW